MISKKSLICLIIAVVVIGLGVYFAVMFNPDSDESENVSGNLITIYDKDVEALNEIDVELKNESFSFVKADGKFVNKEFPDIKLKSSVVDSLASDISILTAKDIIEEGNINKAKYGLDTPKAKITAVFDDETIVLLVGGNTKDSAYFAMLDGTDRVFTLYSTRGDSFVKEFINYRDTQILLVDGQKLLRVQVTGGINDIYLEKTDEKWVVSSPLKRDADETSVNEKIFSVISYFNAESFIDDSSDNYAQYGLLDGAKTVYIEDSFGTKQKFYFGKSENGYCYVRIDGKNGVFTMKDSAMSVFDVKIIEIVDSFVFIPNINEVKSVEITTDSKKHLLEIDDTVYKIDGVQILENKFKSVYQAVVGLRLSDFCFEKPSGSVICKVKFTLNDLSQRTFEYTDESDRQSIVCENGNAIGYVSKKLLSELFMMLEN